MTPAEQHEQAVERIRELRALVEAGTPGPWDWGGNGVAAGERMICDDTLESARAHRDAPETWLSVVAQDNANGRLIASAVNLLPAALDMAEGVLERHAPLASRIEAENGRAYCRECGAWPCPDAAAVLALLGVTP